MTEVPSPGIGTASGHAPLPKCPVCGATAWAPPYARTRLRRCRICGTVLNDRSESRQEEARYQASRAPRLDDERRVAARQWAWLRTCVLLPAGRARPSVLDIGCGYGAFLEAAREDGALVTGVELCPAAVARCRAAGLHVLAGSLFDVSLPASQWDVVTFWDVLEHLESPCDALRLVAQVLAPEGVVIIRGRNGRLHVPAKVAYACARSLMRCVHVPDLACVHRWAFTPDGYRRMLQGCGFSAVEMHPALPTPGDRHSTYGRPVFASIAKGLATGACLLAQRTAGLSLFPSVLFTARQQ